MLTEAEERYIPIPLETITVKTAPDFNLYLYQGGGRYTFYREKHTVFRKEDALNLMNNNNKSVYVAASEYSKYQAYLSKNLDKFLSNADTPLEHRAKTLYSISTKLLKEIFRRPRRQENIEIGKGLVNNTIKFLLHDKGAFSSLFSIRSHDYYTFTHSVHVSNLLIAFAKKMSFDDNDLEIIGIGGLFHDIGKSYIPLDILNKKGPLTKEEFTVMKRHVYLGNKILAHSEVMDKPSKHAVIEHHEKYDGTGYPRGLSGVEISPIGRMAAIVDIYDALSSRRSYKEAFDPFSALSLMKDNMSEQLDMDMLKIFAVLLFSQDIA